MDEINGKSKVSVTRPSLAGGAEMPLSLFLSLSLRGRQQVPAAAVRSLVVVLKLDDLLVFRPDLPNSIQGDDSRGHLH